MDSAPSSCRTEPEVGFQSSCGQKLILKISVTSLIGSLGRYIPLLSLVFALHEIWWRGAKVGAGRPADSCPSKRCSQSSQRRVPPSFRILFFIRCVCLFPHSIQSTSLSRITNISTKTLVPSPPFFCVFLKEILSESLGYNVILAHFPNSLLHFCAQLSFSESD